MNRRTFFARAAVAPLVAIKPVEPGAASADVNFYHVLREEFARSRQLSMAKRISTLDEEGADWAESIRQRKAEIAEMQRRGMLP